MASTGQMILVTGGAEFIGTHTVLQLLKGGFRVLIIDNLDNCTEESITQVRRMVGPDFSKKLQFTQGDLRKTDDLERLFTKTKFDAVIHFAGLKAVGESVAFPCRYFENNIVGTLNLINTMVKFNCKMMVFSSSATVYGQPEKTPCDETFELRAMNPYGRTKLWVEEIFADIHKADPSWRIILLRYFNPIGAHESGTIGEDPKGIPNNLVPFIQQVAVGRLPQLNVYGHDYPTKDGTAVVLRTTWVTGQGTSVFEMIAAFEKASGKKIPYKLCPRRPGDATIVYASTTKAAKELGWKAKFGIAEMCRDQWNWASKSPWGYQSKKPEREAYAQT